MRFTDSPHIAPGDLKGAVPPNVFAADSSLVWQARDGREHWVAFDLKVRRRVTQFVCTAGGERASRNPRECSLEYAASLSGPWALAKRFSGARDKRETVVDELRSKSGAAFVDARYFRLVVHSTFGGTSGRNHGATIASVRFIGDSPQQTPMSYQRDVAITSMAQLGELTFTQGFAALMVDGLRHVIVAIRHRGDAFEEVRCSFLLFACLFFCLLIYSFVCASILLFASRRSTTGCASARSFGASWTPARAPRPRARCRACGACCASCGTARCATRPPCAARARPRPSQCPGDAARARCRPRRGSRRARSKCRRCA